MRIVDAYDKTTLAQVIVEGDTAIISGYSFGFFFLICHLVMRVNGKTLEVSYSDLVSTLAGDFTVEV